MTALETDLLRDRAYVDGAWIDADSGATFPVLDPATGATIAEVPRMGAAETRRAIEAAQRALPSWKHRTAKDRARILRRLADLMIERSDDLAALLVREQGKPLFEAKLEIGYAASFYEWFGEEAKRLDGGVIPQPLPDRRIVVLKEAIGVTAGITPWNFPAAMPTRKSAPALAVGCTMVLKPAEQTPLTALAIAALKVADGFTEGAQVGPLIDEPAVAKVERHVADALAHGADLRLGGSRIEGQFFQPSVLTGVTMEMAMSCEETFGPVAGINRFKSDAEAIAIANDTPYGLSAYFYTRDLGRTWRVAEALEYGIVGINTGFISSEVAPFGGMKESGIGREGSSFGVDDWVELKYLAMGGIGEAL